MIRRTYQRRPGKRPLTRRPLRIRRTSTLRRPRVYPATYRRRPGRVAYLKKKRRPYWRQYRRPGRIIQVVHTNQPDTVYVSGSNRALTSGARESLRRRGLWRGVWRQRLSYPAAKLARFINRFYLVPGFEYVVQDYFARPYQRQRAKRVIQLAHRLASEHSNYRQRLLFERIVRLDPNGEPQATVAVNLGNVRYRI